MYRTGFIDLSVGRYVCFSPKEEFHMSIKTKNRSSKNEWLIPFGLILLTAIPMLGGIARIAGLASGAPVTPENARFVGMPLPVIIHIFSATLYCLVGAFQFAPGFRRRRPDWHRRAGRALVVLGIAAGLSGLWMTQFYAVPVSLQGSLLYGVRWLVGSGMVIAIVLAMIAIVGRRDVAQHSAWMIRAYALGQGAGTQVLVLLPVTLIFGESTGLLRDVLMTLAWIINVVLAEWIIRRQPSRTQLAQRTPRVSSPIPR
jgi:Predicted membrane protein (DUF2306)